MKINRLLRLFISTFYLSSVTFGGGYVIVTFMKRIFTDKLHWITEDEMLDLIAIAQAAPGAVAVNGAVAVGYAAEGIAGAAASLFGAILPPLILISLLSVIYDLIAENVIVGAFLKGMQAGIAAMIISVTYDMTVGLMNKGNAVISVAVMLSAFIANAFFHVSAVWIILFCALLGLGKTMVEKNGEGEK